MSVQFEQSRLVMLLVILGKAPLKLVLALLTCPLGEGDLQANQRTRQTKTVFIIKERNWSTANTTSIAKAALAH